MARVKVSGKDESISSRRKGQAPGGVAKAGLKGARPRNAEAGSAPARRRAGTGSVSPPAKRYLKGRSTCRVTFRLPVQAAPEECAVHLAGDFNGWDAAATPMSRLKSGDYTATLNLEPGREYRFRYLIDGCRWENDWNADRYEPNPYGGCDSVVAV